MLRQICQIKIVDLFQPQAGQDESRQALYGQI